MSQFIPSLFPFLSDYGTENVLKTLAGRTDVEDSLQRLVTFTKEETMMARAVKTALCYAVLCGFSGLAEYLFTTRAEDANANTGYQGTVMHEASHNGHVDVVHWLLRRSTDVNSKVSFD
jgi:hypothetical protein